jgi:hypothetical protein
MLKIPEAGPPSRISTSRILFGQTAPEPFGDPAKGEYQSLRAGGPIRDLRQASGADGTTHDLTTYPTRRGFDDLVMVVHESQPDFAWTAVTFPAEHYVWYSLKDPRVLRCTIFWFSNGGRHAPPWNGRHTGVLGVEEVTAYFHYGLAESARANPFSGAGFPTSVVLRPGLEFTVNYIMGVAVIPAAFGRVKSILRTASGIEIKSDRGVKVQAAVDTGFLNRPADGPAARPDR